MKNVFLFRLAMTGVIVFSLAFSPFLRRVSMHSADPEVYAIKGGTIVTGTGATIPNGVVVVRDGLIAAVGSDVAIPADARVVDASGMMVYPGLIDAYSSYGLRPAEQPQGGPGGRGGGGGQQAAILAALSGAATNTNAGLLPEVTVADQLQVAAETFDQQRGAGITAALTSPRDGIFRGQSAFLNLGSDTPEKLLLKAPHSLSIGFGRAGFGGGYPNSGMGVFSFLRQALLDAQHYRDEWDWYSKSPRGKTRPQHDKSLAALIPVVTGKMPVIFNVSSVREIQRAVGLAEEFNLKYLLAGATQSYQIADYLKQKNATVLLSLSFPQKPAGLEDPESESLRVLRERAEAPKAAAALYKAGVKFAFTSGTLTRPADFIANAAKAVEAGLPKDEALKAMTLYPAQIFGLAEQLGSIEKGKIANLIVTSGDLFNRDTKVKYTFVDGKQYIIKAQPEAQRQGPPFGNGRPGGGRPPNGGNAPNAPAVAANATAIDVTGTWTLTVNPPGGGSVNRTLTLKQSGDTVTGEITSGAGPVTISNGKVSGNELSFVYVLKYQDNELMIGARAKIEGNSMSGMMETNGTSYDFSGTRNPK
ncbi:MAG: amidohydrolase family protein [Acidobacteria bacterium]|nr:amidohydrolase family protein [Acidobacteriota bacterium]